MSQLRRLCAWAAFVLSASAWGQTEYRVNFCTFPWAATPQAACDAAAAALPQCDRPEVRHSSIVASLPDPGACTLNWDFTDDGNPTLRHWSVTWGITTRTVTLPQASLPRGLQADPVQGSQAGAREASCQRSAFGLGPGEPGQVVGNPILPATGEKVQVETDDAGEGADLLPVVRTYRSRWLTSPRVGAAPALSPTWIHSHEASLQRVDDAQGQGISVVFPNGEPSAFRRNATGQPWVAQAGDDRLLDQIDGWQLRRPADDSVWTFDAQGRLTSLTRRGGRTWRYVHADGLLARVLDDFGRQLSFQWTPQRRLASVTLADGRVIAYGYDAQGRLASVTQPDGTQRLYHYEHPTFAQALTGLTDEAGQRYASWTYDAQGRATSSQHANGTQAWQVAYPDNATAVVTDPLQTVRSLRFARVGQRTSLVSLDLPLAGQLPIAHQDIDAAGLVTAETDFLGVQRTYAWDPARQLPLSLTRAANRPEAQAVQVQWHPRLAVPVRVSESGRTTDLTYDDAGRLLARSVTDTATGQVRTWAWAYNALGLPETLTAPGGGVWRQAYDAAGNRTRVTDPAGAVTRFGFDAAGRVLMRTDPSGQVSTYTYDARGRRLSEAVGDEVTRYTYTPTGLLASVLQPDGHQVQYQYDAAQRLVGASDNRGAVITFTLDAMGHRLREQVQDAGGHIARVTARTLDALGRVVSEQAADGQATAFAHDANGVPIRRTDPLGQTLRRSLDGLGRATALTFADNAASTQAWSPLDQLQQLTDPKGVSTTYTANAFGEVLTESSTDIGTRAYQRDADGQVAQVTDAKGQVTRIERDPMGRPVRVVHADGAESRYTYDLAGRLARLEDASGVTDFYRDAPGRLLRKAQSVNDQVDNPSRFELAYRWEGGRLAGITYPSGLVVRYLRERGRITGLQVQRPGRRQTLQPWLTDLAYTALGQPRAWRWAGGDAAARSFDADGRITQTEFARYAYDAAGRITRIDQDLWARSPQDGQDALWVVPLSWQVGYDPRDRLIRFTRAGADTRYGYDANGNRLTSQETVTSDTDLDGQYEGSDYQVNTERALAIEASSNRLLGFTQTVTQTFPPTRPDRPARAPRSMTTPVTYTLDANGAMTSDGLRRFDYDAAGRLSRVRVFRDGEEVAISYLHNALGQRVFKGEPQATQTLPSEAHLGTDFITWLRRSFGWLFAQAQASTRIGTAYLYGDGDGALPAWALLGEYDNGSASGRGRTEYLWLPTEDGGAIPVGLLRGGQLHALHTDPLGTPRLVTNERNEPVWQWPYSAFGDNAPTGVLRATANPKAALTAAPQLLRASTPLEMNLRMPGQYFDAEVGTFYNLMRDVDPQVGRYRQADPQGLGGGLNRFVYASLDPLRRIDPWGLDDFQVIFNRGGATLWVVPPHAQQAQGFAAANLTARDSRGAWADGLYRYLYSTRHRDDAPDSAYGSNGNTVFQVPGCTGCGVHSGRQSQVDLRGGSGVQHVTEGCIRSTDAATQLIDQLIRQGHTPVLEVTP